MNFSNYCLLFFNVCILCTQVHCQMTEKLKNVLLKQHNYYRHILRNGSLKGQPQALNMPDLQWDQNISETAQKWANNCTFKHDDKYHRRPKNYCHTGQNLAAGFSFQQLEERAVGEWFIERYFYNYTTNNCTKVCGHYTQVVWENTTHLGCGIQYCKGKPGFEYNVLLVCNYYPGGNYLGKRPYTMVEKSEIRT